MLENKFVRSLSDGKQFHNYDPFQKYVYSVAPISLTPTGREHSPGHKHTPYYSLCEKVPPSYALHKFLQLMMTNFVFLRFSRLAAKEDIQIGLKAT